MSSLSLLPSAFVSFLALTNIGAPSVCDLVQNIDHLPKISRYCERSASEQSHTHIFRLRYYAARDENKKSLILLRRSLMIFL